MEKPPLTWGTWPLLSHLPWLLREHGGVGEGAGRALQEGMSCMMERREVGQCGGPRNFWALQWWYLEAVADADPKAEVSVEQKSWI